MCFSLGWFLGYSQRRRYGQEGREQFKRRLSENTTVLFSSKPTPYLARRNYKRNAKCAIGQKPKRLFNSELILSRKHMRTVNTSTYLVHAPMPAQSFQRLLEIRDLIRARRRFRPPHKASSIDGKRATNLPLTTAGLPVPAPIQQFQR